MKERFSHIPNSLVYIMKVLCVVLGMFIFVGGVTVRSEAVNGAQEDIIEMTTEEVTANASIADINDDVETLKSIIESDLYFDVPLSTDLQDYIFEVCRSYNISPALIVAIIERESNYNVDNIGDNGESFGLMQIQAKWHQERMDILGCDDLMDPYQNILVGTDYLAELFGSGNGIEWALMAYNGGPSYANNMVSQGLISDYAKDVLYIYGELEGV